MLYQARTIVSKFLWGLISNAFYSSGKSLPERYVIQLDKPFYLS